MIRWNKRKLCEKQNLIARQKVCDDKEKELKYVSDVEMINVTRSSMWDEIAWIHRKIVPIQYETYGNEQNAKRTWRQREMKNITKRTATVRERKTQTHTHSGKNKFIRYDREWGLQHTTTTWYTPLCCNTDSRIYINTRTRTHFFVFFSGEIRGLELLCCAVLCRAVLRCAELWMCILLRATTIYR